MKLNIKRIAILALYGTGVIVGSIFFGLAVWGDLEASLFSSGIIADEVLTTMSCPILITPNETGQVSAVLVNPLDRLIHAAVRVQVSSGLVTFKREETQQIDLQPGERQKVAWDVTPEDAVWDRIIFARVYQFANYPEKSKGGSCGILVLNFPFLTGFQWMVSAIAISLATMGSGLFLWHRLHRPLQGRVREATRAMNVLAVIVVAGILTAVFAMWFFGLLLLLLALILVGSVIANLSTA